MALAKAGAQLVSSLTDQTNTSALAINQNWQLSVSEVGRAHSWNCLMKATVLSPTPQIPITNYSLPGGTTVWQPYTSYTAGDFVTYSGNLYQCIVNNTSSASFVNDLAAGYWLSIPIGTIPWAPATSYAAGAFVTYGGALYQALIANVSSASFINDLTKAWWFETDIYNPNPFGQAVMGDGAQYPSGWAYQYPLPSDFLLLSVLNDFWCNQAEVQYEIIGQNLYTNYSQAVIKYVAYNTDTTIFDSLFTAALVCKLAQRVATSLRQDDTAIAGKLEVEYQKALRDARVKDAGERKPFRFSPVNNSRLVASRYSSTNS